MSHPLNSFCIFQLESIKFALPLSCIKQVIQAVGVTQIEEVHPLIKGMIKIDHHFRVVINTRYKFSQNDRPIDPQDYFVIINLKTGKIILWVDDIIDIIHTKDAVLRNILKQYPYEGSVTSLIHHDEEIIYVYEPTSFFNEQLQFEMEHALQ